MEADEGYRLPDELARHARKGRFAPDELRDACRGAGEGLGGEHARAARFRSAAERSSCGARWNSRPRVAPYALRDARLGYIQGFTNALVSGGLSEERASRAAEARWGAGWPERPSWPLASFRPARVRSVGLGS